jgi:anti-sigma factor RsiW
VSPAGGHAAPISGVELDPEERRRVDAAIGTCAALVEETSRKAVADDPTGGAERG